MLIKVTNFKEWLAATQKRVKEEALERMKYSREKLKGVTEDDNSRETSTDSE